PSPGALFVVCRGARRSPARWAGLLVRITGRGLRDWEGLAAPDRLTATWSRSRLKNWSNSGLNVGPELSRFSRLPNTFQSDRGAPYKSAALPPELRRLETWKRSGRSAALLQSLVGRSLSPVLSPCLAEAG